MLISFPKQSTTYLTISALNKIALFKSFPKQKLTAAQENEHTLFQRTHFISWIC